MATPRVVVSILCWNSGQHIQECLASLRAMDYGNLEIVVVDNGSTDDSAELVRSRFPEATLLRNPQNLGFTAGHNQAIRHALTHGADYVWLLNDDATVEPTTLSWLIRVAASDTRVGLVSPVVYYRDEPDRVQFGGSYLDWSNFEVVCSSQLDEVSRWQALGEKPMMLWGTALLLSRALLESIGGLDERFFAYFEDTDLSLRAIEAGFINRMAFDARIYHNSPALTLSRPPHFHYLMTRNEWLFWRKHMRRSGRIRFLRCYLAKSLRAIGKYQECGLPSSRDAVVAGVWDALAGHAGPPQAWGRAPRLVSRLLTWRPYLLALLLEGRWRQMVREGVRRVRPH